MVGDPNLLVGDAAGTLFSLDARTGVVGATFAADAAPVGSPAIGDPDQYPWIFVGDRAGNLYALDQTEKLPSTVWQTSLGAPVGGSPVLANGVLYTFSDPMERAARIAALDAGSGRELFEAELPDAASSPIVADGRLVVVTQSGDVLAYEVPNP
jgi:outer membrane protein assembly factor BamB